MHNLFHYERETNPSYACAQELRNHGLIKGYESDRVYEALDRYFRSRLVLRPNRKLEKAQNPLWRLTLPVWSLVFVLMAFVVLPLRWLVTGEYKVHYRSGAFGWLRAWHQKMFPWPKP
jgi:hypothetical protein